MNLNEWAIDWGVPFAAVEDLRRRMCGVAEGMPRDAGMHTEAGVTARVRLEATAKGARLWRNNVGACMDSNGNFIRYGLANDSSKINAAIKSSDLIGIRPGGQFVARECKAAGWQFSGTEREIAQMAFLQLVIGMGGDAAFATGEGTL